MTSTSPSDSPLRIVYAGTQTDRATELLAYNQNIIVLMFDRWDDHDFKTTLPTRCKLNGESVPLGAVQILIDGHLETHDYLSALRKSGWDGEFPIPSTNYISVPAALTFYEQILGHLSPEDARHAATLLRDASFLVKVKEDQAATLMIKSDGFKKSLQRETGAIRAFNEGWKLLTDQGIKLGNQDFLFTSTMGNELTLSLRFTAPVPLPYDINVLIGPNGTGKSQLLLHMVRDWLNLEKSSEQTKMGRFKDSPNFSQVVVVSYSPFEKFPVDSADSSRKRDKDDYRYFGLRGRRTLKGDRTLNTRSQVRLSKAFPSADAAHSLVNCLADDLSYGAIRDWSQKVQTAYDVLADAIEFEYLAVAVPAEMSEGQASRLNDGFRPYEGYLTRPTSGTLGLARLIPIEVDFGKNLDIDFLKEVLLEREGVFFVNDGKVVELSSGQRLFSYIVINILGAIRRNSLIIVDEPELFLHPNLEIAFLRMLKSILRAFGSKALIATHSLVTVREMPSECVHVLDRTDDGVVIKHPPFETFGGDIQRISSYVFGDKSVSKPFEEWIREQIQEKGGAEQLLAALGEDVNEEMIIQIRAMGRGQW